MYNTRFRRVILNDSNFDGFGNSLDQLKNKSKRLKPLKDKEIFEAIKEFYRQDRKTEMPKFVGKNNLAWDFGFDSLDICAIIFFLEKKLRVNLIDLSGVCFSLTFTELKNEIKKAPRFQTIH